MSAPPIVPNTSGTSRQPNMIGFEDSLFCMSLTKDELVTQLHRNIEQVEPSTFDDLKAKTSVFDAIIAAYSELIHDPTSDPIENSRNANMKKCLKQNEILNAHLKAFVEFAMRTNASVSVLKSSDTDTHSALNKLISEYVEMTYPSEPSDFEVVMPSSYKKSAKTLKESTANVYRAVNKALSDINPARARNLIEQSNNLPAAEEFKDRMRTYKQLNEEENQEMKRLARALNELKTMANPEMMEKVVNRTTEALGFRDIQFVNSNPEKGKVSSEDTKKVGGKGKGKSKNVRNIVHLQFGGLPTTLPGLTGDFLKRIILKDFEENKQKIIEEISTNFKLGDELQNKVEDLRKYLANSNTGSLKQEVENKANSLLDGFAQQLKTSHDDVNNQIQTVKQELSSNVVELGKFFNNQQAGITTYIDNQKEDIKNNVGVKLLALNSNVTNFVEDSKQKVATTVSSAISGFNEHQDIVHNDITSKIESFNSNVQQFIQEKQRGVDNAIALTISNLKTKIGAIESTAMDAVATEAQLTAVNNTITKQLGDISRINTSLDESNRSFDEFKSRLIESQKSFTATSGQLTDHVMSVGNLHEMIMKIKQDLLQRETDVTSIKDRIKTSTSNVEEIEGIVKQSDSLKTTIHDLESQVNAFNAQFSAMQQATNVDKLQVDAGTLQDAIEATSTQTASAKSTLDNLERDIKVIETKLASVSTSFDQTVLAKQEEINKLGAESVLALNKTIAELSQDKIITACLENTTFKERLFEIIKQVPETRGGDGFKELLRKRLYNLIPHKDVQEILNSALPADLLESLPGFVKEIKTKLLEEGQLMKNIEEIKKVVQNITQFATSITIFKEELKDTKMEDVRAVIYTKMSSDLESLSVIVKEAQSGISQKNLDKYEALKNAFETKHTLKDLKWRNLVNDEVSAELLKDLSDYYEIKDALFPVRIVLNYRKAENESDPRVVQNYEAQQSTGGNPTMTKLLFEHEKLPKSTSTIGPYYKITDSSKNDYNVEQDIDNMLLNRENVVPHIVYSAYGFSGSGKSYTLIQAKNKSNVLSRVISTLQKDPSLRASYRIFDYYGERDDGGCLSSAQMVGGGMTGQKYRKLKRCFLGSSNKFTEPLSVDTLGNLPTAIERFEAIRKGNLASSPNGSELYWEKDSDVSSESQERHIRETPNNPESSRSHLLAEVCVRNKDGVIIGFITIMDMAGNEDVDAIQNMYFESMDSYDVAKFNDQLSQSNVESNSTMGKLMKLKNGTFIDVKRWEVLLGERKERSEFLQNYNVMNYIYTYMSMLSMVNKIGRKLGILDYITTNAGVRDTSKSGPRDTNKTIDYTSGIRLITGNMFALNDSNKKELLKSTHFIPDKFKNFYANIENSLKEFLQLIATYENKIGLKGEDYVLVQQHTLSKVFKYVEKVIDELKRDAGESIIKQRRAEFLATYKSTTNTIVYLTNFLNKAGPGAKRGTMSGDAWYVKSLSKLYEDPYQFTSESASESGERGVTLNILKQQLRRNLSKWDDVVCEKVLQGIGGWLQEMNSKYLYNIHCPLRFQGVFINDTLNDLELYVNHLQDTRTINTKLFPGNLIHNYTDSSLQGKVIKPKFVLFTNIRLDFDANINDQNNVMNFNLREAYVRSLEFSNKINPLVKKSGISGGAPSAPAPAPAPAPAATGNMIVVDTALTKETLRELQDIKRDLNASITAFENLQVKVDRFKEFTKQLNDDKAAKDENLNIGIYNYLKEEGLALKDEFKKTVESQNTKLKALQKKLVKLLETEPQTKIITDMLALLTTVMEEKISGKDFADNKGVYNEISKFLTNFENEFNDAYRTAKRLASGIQEKRQLELRNQQDRNGYGYGYSSSSSSRERELRKQQEQKLADLEKRLEGLDKDRNTPTLDPPDGTAPPQATGEGTGIEEKEVALSPSASPKDLDTTKDVTKYAEIIIKGLQEVIDKVVVEVEKILKKRVGPAMSMMTSDSLFNKILSDYVSKKDENDVVARQNFMEALETNNLIPRKVLEVTRMDKIIFGFLTLFIRMFSTSLIVFMIEKNKIKNMFWAVMGYLILYTLVLVGFTLFVNLDMYRMRIIFNYVNFHANSGKLYTHLLMLYLLGALLFLIMSRINFPVQGVNQKVMTDNDKLRLIMRVQILTMILWVVMTMIMSLA